MLNAEKFKDKILSIADDGYLFAIKKNDKGNVIRCCSDMNCQDCIFDDEESEYCGYNIPRLKWLFAEYKEPIKLTRLEYELLKFWNSKKYNYIARDSNGMVYVYHEKPSKKAEVWGSIYKHHVVEEFDKSFQFVQWEDSEPTSIQEVLENCEVVNDAKE